MRYAISGGLNTAIGFGIIFVLMALGVPAVLANILGYTVGFIQSFFFSKKFVFRSKGKIASEGLRYLYIFLISFLVNLAVLKIFLTYEVKPVLAQLAAAGVYSGFMYVLSARLVFRPKRQNDI
ncbi:GtrA family protein [Achromobacter sp. B7]|uniref:GtrA family protein n=1 Tax=Achromobacter sp. B7 TaxID=2282475 RepID=UPI0013C4432A|nr:GtrA family protein [Achromobacter sp. B7]